MLGMKIWIVGLPNVGKSTLFNALTKTYSADAANFPFCTIEPNIGIVDVKDERLDKLSEISGSKTIIYSTIKFVDIAGLVKWAAEWAWLWNKFLAHIREVDAIVQVIRHFDDADVIHVHNKIDPLDDADVINTELMIADLEQVEKSYRSLEKNHKKTKEQEVLFTVIELAFHALNAWKPANTIIWELNAEQKKVLKWLNLLTSKPLIYAINVSEDNLNNYKAIEAEYSAKLWLPVKAVCAKFESELLQLDESERSDYISWFGDVPTLDNLIWCAFDTVGLMYYFTTGEKETRSWSIPKNSTAPQAAGAIHTDFERWFIKAEVVNYENFIKAWTWVKAKESGYLKLEWKDYVVQNGDIIVFKFNV